MTSISFKLASFFLTIIFVSTAISFAAVSLLSRQVADEIALDQTELAQAIRALRDKTALSVDDIVAIMSTSTYSVRQVEFIDPAGIAPGDLVRLEEDRIVLVRRGRFQGTTTLLRLGDSYISIGLHPQHNVLNIMVSRLWNSIALYLIIAAGLVLVLTKRVVHPVLELTAATQEVAAGRFDVQLQGQRNDEIGQLTTNFNQMVRRLREIEYLRKDFISNVSHEIKTPLASIHGYAKLLQHEGLTADERAEYTAVIMQEASRLSHLSSVMLRLSKLENLDSIADQTRFRLDEQIRHSILLLEPQWSAKQLELNIELESVVARGNEELLQQVWLNLLGNAIKFSASGGTVDISLRSATSGPTVCIRDYGVGIQQEDLPRIFERFFQVDRAHSGEGSGLGLSLVKRILDLHDARIEVWSRPSEGSSFTIQLPETDHE